MSVAVVLFLCLCYTQGVREFQYECVRRGGYGNRKKEAADWRDTDI